MRYFPHTDEDIRSMLETVGVGSFDALFSTLPKECRRTEPIDLPEPLSEWELNDLMDGLASTMAVGPEYKIFLGAGSYEHFIPETIPYLTSRSEFSTAYTPYQPEMSQGTLQAIFEYQTLTARLLGMEVANASLYDGATALAEGLLMAVRITRRKKLVLSRSIHPHYRLVVKTYLAPTGVELIELTYDAQGRTEEEAIDNAKDYAAVALQTPNFFGCVEDLRPFSDKAHRQGGLLVCCFTEPLAYGLFKNPGSLGTDIACGEGQSLGIRSCFGGPGLGMFACRKEYVRTMPGRVVGEARDMEGRRGFVLTLAAREQHIRREKATSNICTNNSLCAVTAAMYLASLGGTGFRLLARLNYDKSEYLKRELRKAGVSIPFESATFNEFVVRLPGDFGDTYRRLVSKKIVPGLPLDHYYPELSGHYLLCVTETKTRQDMDDLVKEIAQ